MSKPGVFYMKFSFDDNTKLLCGFNITPEGVSKLQQILDEGDFYNEFAEPIVDEFGVHDWSSRTNDAVEGIGYTSYEIELNKVDDCMYRWKTVIGEYVGDEHVSELVLIEIDNNDDDFDIYNKVDRTLQLKTPQI